MKRDIRANDCRFQDDVVPIAQIELVRRLCLTSLRIGKNTMWHRREPIELKAEKMERRKKSDARKVIINQLRCHINWFTSVHH